MKKVILVTLLCVLAFTGYAFAWTMPFFSTGIVDPDFNDTWNPATLSGTARYYFYFSNPNVTVNQLSLRFEGDVFDLTQLTASKINVVNPASWGDLVFSDVEGDASWSMSFGSPITGSQDPIILDAQYTLLGMPQSLNWDEGQVWGQSYTLSGKYDMGLGLLNPDGTSGGSTSPVPEPASLALLGMGVLGLFGLRKKS